jgi:hypothetical protein
MFFDGSKSVTTVEAAAIPLGIRRMLFGAGYTRVFAGAAPAEHRPG